MDPTQVIIEPIITEKTMDYRADNRYVFKVHPRATKVAVRSAVEKLFKVKVKDVNTVSVRGKKRMWRSVEGRKSNFKKAYVTLKSGKIEELEI